MDKDKTVFVKLDDFKDIGDILSMARQKLEHLKGVLAKIDELKAREDAAVEQWKAMVKDVESRLESVDSKLMQR